MMPDFVDDGFTDMLEGEEGMPVHGVRMLTFMDEEGQTWLKWVTSGEPSLNDLIVMFTRGAFLAQVKELAHAHEDEDEYDE